MVRAGERRRERIATCTCGARGGGEGQDQGHQRRNNKRGGRFGCNKSGLLIFAFSVLTRQDVERELPALTCTLGCVILGACAVVQSSGSAECTGSRASACAVRAGRRDPELLPLENYLMDGHSAAFALALPCGSVSFIWLGRHLPRRNQGV